MSATRLLVPSKASTSSLPGREADVLYLATPPATILSPPPPSHLELYGKKPLPPIPAKKRQSVASTLSKEMSRVFDTPHGSIDLDRGQLEVVDWSKEEAEIAVILDRQVRPNPSPSPPPSSLPRVMKMASRKAKWRVETAARAVPNTPPDELLSPQPRVSVQKILKLTSVRPIGNSSSSSPSGHNSPQKIKQLMGMDLGPDESYRRWLAEDRAAGVSPLSNRSSVYSQDMDMAVSEADSLDLNTGFENDGYASDPNMSYLPQRPCPKVPMAGSRHPVPSPLNIFKGERSHDDGRGARTGGQIPHTPSARDFARTGDGNRDGSQGSRYLGDRYGQDLYHATTAQIARSIPSTPPHWQHGGPPRGSRAPPVTPRSSIPRWTTGSRGAVQTPSSSQTPHSPLPLGTSRASPSAGDAMFRSTSTNDFGGPWHSHRPPQSSPDPAPEYTHHSDLNITIPRHDDTARTTSPSPRHNHRSIMSKVFSKHSSGAAAPSPAHAKTPSNATVTSAPASAAEPTTSSPSKSSSWTHRYTRSAGAGTGGKASAGMSLATAMEEASWMKNSLPSPRLPAASLHLPAAMASMGSLAQKTGDMVEHARTTAGIRTRTEKKRESLKSGIVVVGEGSKVLGEGGGAESSVPGLTGTGTGVKVKGGGAGRGMLQGDGPWI